MPKPQPNELFTALRAGDTVALSRAITLVESSRAEHRKQAEVLLQLCLPYAGRSFRIGITGVPGVGKSTLIEQLGLLAIAKDHSVAVLAVDPSSRKTGGSILGDKTRMEKLSVHPRAFIRPSAAGTTLGGVAGSTREAIILLEAAGYDMILVETVGVGQSETAVHSMTDLFLLLLLSGAGDELQGIKRGIMEMADIVAVNKADGDNVIRADQTRMDFKRALHLFPPPASGWTVPVLTCSALTGTGMEHLLEQIMDYRTFVNSNGFLERNRSRQLQYWFHESLQQQLMNQLTERFPDDVEAASQAVLEGRELPSAAIAALLNRLFSR
ncbi:MAG: methylmalonyl Co-A mutase-associated GTPase MeaB [Chitinophagales bacterium]|nr:methylmalonyl Co-A mutase-associated GTPase MeaB [Chitinophagales bacterium]